MNELRVVFSPPRLRTVRGYYLPELHVACIVLSARARQAQGVGWEVSLC